MAVLTSCQDVTIGFLNIEKAGYEIDSLEVKVVLDNAVPEIITNPEYEEYIDMGFDPEVALKWNLSTLEIGGGEVMHGINITSRGRVPRLKGWTERLRFMFRLKA